ncbi:lipase family protein [Listeria seeligeri]|uniref:lipase family protein n=1 Tax=Listeria seeligeri TaxID=1640 RepID=UPI0022EA2E7F|nr:lipase [Listeria seeligeri]
MKVRDDTNFYLSDEVYNSSYLKKGQKIKLINKETWVTINSVNKDNGLQAIAVVPLKDYKDYNNGKLKTYNHIVFVSRGSEELDDWNENLGLVAKKDNKEGQFKAYDKFVNGTLEKFKTQDYSFTGHSLGGGLAQYEAVKHLKPAVTFAAARAFNKLTGQEQEKALNGEYWNLIKDYYHKDDVVGKLPPNAEVFYKQYLMERNSSENKLDKLGIGGHMQSTFTGCFEADGSAELLINPDEIINQIERLDEVFAKMRQVENYMQDYEEWEKMQSQRLRSQLDEETWEGGKYSELTSWDVDDVLTEVSRKYKDGVYRFHNTDKFEEFYDGNRKTIQKLNGFKEEVISAALAFNDKDKELGNWIKENSKGW